MNYSKEMESYVKEGVLYRVIKSKEEAVECYKLFSDMLMIGLPILRGKEKISSSIYKSYDVVAQFRLETSIIIGAFDQESGKMIGGIVIDDNFGDHNTGGDPYERLHPIFNPTVNVMAKANQEVLDEGLITKDKGKYLHLVIIVVHTAYRGRGIARELTELSERIAKEQGYEYCYIDLVSKEYQNLCLSKCGYTEIKSIPYLDFEMDGKKLFEDVIPLIKPGEEDISFKIAIKKV